MALPSCSEAWVSSPSRTVRASSASSRFFATTSAPVRSITAGPNDDFRSSPASASSAPARHAVGVAQSVEHMYESYRSDGPPSI